MTVKWPGIELVSCRSLVQCLTYRTIMSQLKIMFITRMWANAQHDGRHDEHRWPPLFNAAKFGWRSLLDCRAV